MDIITENLIHIKHRPKPFLERMLYHMFWYLLILAFISLIIINGIKHKDIGSFFEVFSFSYFIQIPILFFGIKMTVNILRSKKYIFYLHADSNKISIKYLNWSTEKVLESTIDKIKVVLTRSNTKNGYYYTLFLTLENDTFRINDDFAWSKAEMKDLFLFIKKKQNKELTLSEKSMILKII